MAKEIDLGSIVGPQGPQGPPGEKGDKGEKGDQGPEGTVDIDTIKEEVIKIETGRLVMETGWGEEYSSVRKISGQVYLDFKIFPKKKKTAGFAETAATIPVGFRPFVSAFTVGIGTGINRCSVIAASDGRLKIEKYGAASSSDMDTDHFIWGHVNYPAGKDSGYIVPLEEKE